MFLSFRSWRAFTCKFNTRTSVHMLKFHSLPWVLTLTWKLTGKKSQTSFDFAKLQIERENGNIASTRREPKREMYSSTLLTVSNYNHMIHQISLFCCRWLFYRANNGHRKQLCELLHSHKAQYAIIALVVVDMIIVIAELLLDLKAIKGGIPSSF